MATKLGLLGASSFWNYGQPEDDILPELDLTLEEDDQPDTSDPANDDGGPGFSLYDMGDPESFDLPEAVDGPPPAPTQQPGLLSRATPEQQNLAAWRGQPVVPQAPQEQAPQEELPPLDLSQDEEPPADEVTVTGRRTDAPRRTYNSPMEVYQALRDGTFNEDEFYAPVRERQRRRRESYQQEPEQPEEQQEEQPGTARPTRQDAAPIADLNRELTNLVRSGNATPETINQRAGEMGWQLPEGTAERLVRPVTPEAEQQAREALGRVTVTAEPTGQNQSMTSQQLQSAVLNLLTQADVTPETIVNFAGQNGYRMTREQAQELIRKADEAVRPYMATIYQLGGGTENEDGSFQSVPAERMAEYWTWMANQRGRRIRGAEVATQFQRATGQTLRNADQIATEFNRSGGAFSTAIPRWGGQRNPAQRTTVVLRAANDDTIHQRVLEEMPPDDAAEFARKAGVRFYAQARLVAGQAVTHLYESGQYRLAQVGQRQYDPLNLHPEEMQAAEQARAEVERRLTEQYRAGTLPGQALAREAEKDLRDNEFSPQNPRFVQYVGMVIDSLPGMIAAAGATMITRNPAVGLAIIGEQGAAQRYASSRQAGRTIDQSGMDALVSGLAEAVPEMLPLHALIAPGKKFFARVLTTGGLEGASEVMTEAVNIGYEWGVLNSDMTFGEAMARLRDSGIVGMLTGSGLAAAAHPIEMTRERRARIDQANRNIDEALARDVDRVLRDVMPSADESARAAQSPSRRRGDVDPDRGRGLDLTRSTSGPSQNMRILPGQITSRFGRRTPFRTRNGQMSTSNHMGIDVAMPEGTNIPAMVEGEVVFAGPRGGLGNAVAIRGADGRTYWAGHMSRVGVEVGARVSQGDSIGKVGQTGNATGPHVHYAVRDPNGQFLNPLNLRPQRGGARARVVNMTEVRQAPEPTDYADAFQDNEVEAPQEADTSDEPVSDYLAQQAEARDQEASEVRERAVRAPTAERAVEIAQEVPAAQSSRDTAPAQRIEERLNNLANGGNSIQRSLVQPQDNEEPVFRMDPETGLATEEVVGFQHNETGAFRPIPTEEAAPVEEAPTQAAPTGINVEMSPTQTVVTNAAPEQIAQIEQATGSRAVPRSDGAFIFPLAQFDTIQETASALANDQRLQSAEPASTPPSPEAVDVEPVQDEPAPASLSVQQVMESGALPSEGAGVAEAPIAPVATKFAPEVSTPETAGATQETQQGSEPVSPEVLRDAGFTESEIRDGGGDMARQAAQGYAYTQAGGGFVPITDEVMTKIEQDREDFTNREVAPRRARVAKLKKGETITLYGDGVPMNKADAGRYLDEIVAREDRMVERFRRQNVRWREANVAKVPATAAAPEPVPAPAPVAEDTLPPAITAGGERGGTSGQSNSAVPDAVTQDAAEAPGDTESSAKNQALQELERRAERYDEKLFDLEVDGDKAAVRRFVKKLVKDGVISQAEADSLDPIFKDRDMDVEDITSELRTSLSMWHDEQRAAIEGSDEKAKSATPKGEEDGRSGDDREAGSEQADQGGGRERGELRGEAGVLDEQAGSPALDTPLAGAPGPIEIPGRGLVQFGPVPAARQAAITYMKQAGRNYAPPTRYVKVNVERAKRIAQAFEEMKHDPQNPEVRRAYAAMAAETIAQWNVIKETGLKVEFIPDGIDPYEVTPRLAHLDVVENNHLWVFPTDSGYGSDGITAEEEEQNPLLAIVPGEQISGRPVRVNDIFRIVHDYFGHFKDGNGFRAAGEENAWQSHAAMYSPLARRAMTTETRGQNSWLNYGPYGETNRTAKAADTVFADQKIGLLPEWVSEEGFAGDPAYSDAGWTPRRVAKIIKQYDGQGWVAMMNPSEFLGLTISNEGLKALNESNFVLDPDKLADAGPIVLSVTVGGEPSNVQKKMGVEQLPSLTMGHDGRHRMAALAEYGIDRVPVVILNQNGPVETEMNSLSLTPQRSRLDPLANGSKKVTATNLIPINQENRSKIEELGNALQFALGDESGQSDWAQVRAEAESELFDELGKMGLSPEVGRVISFLRGQPNAEGAFHRETNTILIMARMASDVRGVTRHEAIHYMRANNFFTEEEWSALEAWAKDQKGLMAEVRKAYGGRISPEKMVEEAVAEGFSRLMGGEQVNRPSGNVLVRALQKIAEFVRAIVVAMQRRGITHDFAERIMGNVYSGEQARLAEERALTPDPNKKLLAQSKEVRDELGHVRERMHDNGSLETAEEILGKGFWSWTGEELEMAKTLDADPLAFSMLDDPSVPDPSRLRKISNLIRLWGVGTWNRIVSYREQDMKSYDPTDTLRRSLKRTFFQERETVEEVAKRFTKELGYDRLPPELDFWTTMVADNRGHEIDWFMDNLMRPLIKGMNKHKVELPELERFLYAKHAPHRNARIQARNPEFKDGGSGMTDTEAAAIIKEVEDAGRLAEFEELANIVYAMNQKAMELRLEGGLITQEEAAKWFQPDEFYVPLRGFAEMEPDAEMAWMIRAGNASRGFSVKGSDIKMAKGRESEAADILSYVMAQYMSAIDRSYRNRVAQKMLNAFEADPSLQSDFVAINPVKRVAVWNEAKGIVEYQMQTRLNALEEQRTVFVRRDGKTYKMLFDKGNWTAMRFVAQVKNLDVQKVGFLTALFSKLTAMFSKGVTAFDPNFWIRNTEADAGYGMLTVWSLRKKYPGVFGAYLKRLPQTIPALVRAETKPTGAGEGSTKEMDLINAERELFGGRITFNQIDQLAAAQRRLRLEMKRANRTKANPLYWGEKLLKIFEGGVNITDNIQRLALYAALKDIGIEPETAAKEAREVTINFSQRGSLAKRANHYYAFANVGFVGLHMGIRALKRAPGIAAGAVALGVLYGLMGPLMFGDDWDDFTEEEKQRYILLPNGNGGAFPWRMPHFFGGFVTFGRNIAEFMMGKKDRQSGQPVTSSTAAANSVLGFLNALSPVQGQTFANVLAPTLADPWVDLLFTNRNYWGRPIEPEGNPFDQSPNPRWREHFNGTGPVWVAMARAMSDATGGTTVQPGHFDVSAEALKYLAEYYTAGPGRAASNIIDFFSGTSGVSRLPIARALVVNPRGQDPDGQSMANFNERYSQLTRIMETAHAERDVAGPGVQVPYIDENRRLIDFGQQRVDSERNLFQHVRYWRNKFSVAENIMDRVEYRANRALSDTREQRAISQATAGGGQSGIVLPVGREITREQINQVLERLKANRLLIARGFNRRYEQAILGVTARE